MDPMMRKLVDQVDQLAEDRIERNARIRELEAVMRRCAEKLETPGNTEPLEVARMLRGALDG